MEDELLFYIVQQDRQTIRTDRDGRLGKSIDSLGMIIHNNRQKDTLSTLQHEI